MQHHRVRELKGADGGPSGLFHWVGGHDCRARGCDGHPSEDEARACQHAWELAEARETTFTLAHACQECAASGRPKVWTDKAFQMGGYMGEIVHLCDEHRTREVLAKHVEPPGERWVS